MKIIIINNKTAKDTEGSATLVCRPRNHNKLGGKADYYYNDNNDVCKVPVPKHFCETPFKSSKYLPVPTVVEYISETILF